jgi:hypothetical protein
VLCYRSCIHRWGIEWTSGTGAGDLGELRMTCRFWGSFLFVIGLCVPLAAMAQADVASSGCPVAFLGFTPAGYGGTSVHVRNVSAKKIVGLTFNAALADATEHWNWLGWPAVQLVETPAASVVGADPDRLRGFGWNKELKPGAAKTTVWWDVYLGGEHGGGVAMVLTSALFADGSRWDELPDRSSCMALW